MRHSHTPEGAFTVRLACIRPAASVHPEPGSNSSLYIVVLLYFSVLSWRIHLYLVSWNFRFLTFQTTFFIGSLLSKNLQPSFLSIADAKVHHFFTRATLFEKKFSNYFFSVECQRFMGDILWCEAEKWGLKSQFLRPDATTASKILRQFNGKTLKSD